MKHIAGLWENMLAKRTLSMALCLALAVTSGGVCIASTNNLVQETRTAGENGNEGQPESTAETIAQEETKTSAEVSSGTVTMEGEILEEDMKAEEPEDTRCLHEFTATWVGYECKLTDYVDGYEPGDEVRISASFNKPVTSQIGLYIDGVWNSFRGEGKKRNITLVPDSDYLNLQISDLKGQTSVNLTEISVEIIRKGEADTGNYLHKFTGLWQGFETKFSDYNPDYQPGDKIRVTVNYSKYVASQLGMNIGGEWSTLTGEGKELVKEMTPDNDYLNIQITDMWANYKIGILSISVDILQKGPGVSGYGGKGGRLAPTQYKEPGDYLLFSGDANGKYETNDGWILDCADTDWLTLTYSCAPEHENWGILGWGATVNGEWVDGPGYSADSSDSTKEITQNFSLKYLRRMMKITPESDVSYLNLGSYSDGRIEELTLHVGSEIPREDSLFKDGAPNQPWICTDIERILDAPDDMYLCVQYKCAVSDYEGWTVLSWGASVDGEWRNGKSYKVSSREATRNHVFSIRMDAFRNMLHLSWDAKVDSIQLATYNDAQILDIWFSKDKVEDPGDSKKDRGAREGGYSSSNKKTYDDVAKEEGFDYPQNDLTLGPWEWGDIENGEEICQKLKTGSYLIVEYETEDDVEPSLQFIMVDGKQQGVTPTYLTEKREEESERVRENKTKQAIFSYQDIQNFLPDYLIPEEIAYIQISSGDGSMVIKTIRVVTNNTKLEEEPIAVLTSSWSGFSTQLSKWHSDYEVGDTVTVTAAFDKKLPGAIAFNLGGAWNCGSYIDSKIISRTELPDDDYVGIQLGQLPEMSRFAKIMNITVDIAGKPNFNDYVIVTGNRNAGILASTKKEAATAVLSNEEINQGVKVNFVIENGTLSENEAEQIRALFGEQTEDIQIAKVSDITIYKVKEGKQTKVTDTDEPISFKVPVPDEWKNKGYDFSVVREHEGEFTYLEDLDGNPDTVTFASSQFSKFAVVCGEAGVFDGLSGAVKIFRSEWSGWDTSFSKYNEKFKPGKETKVTLTFDKEVKAYVDYHRPEWTRVEGENIGKTFTTTIIPGDDNLGIGIADINGNGIVKLMSLKVEQDAGMVTMFTAKDQKYITTFSAYNEKFVKDYPVTLKLTFDQEVEAGVSYHKTGTMEEIVDFGSTTDKILTKAFTPGDDELRIWLKDMNGNSHIKLIDIEVIQTNVSAIHTFYHTWGQEEDTYSGKISDLCKFEQGDKVRITAIFDKSSSVKMMVTGSDMMLEGTRVSFTATPGTDWFGIQAGDDSKLPLGLLAVTAEVVEKAPPVEGIHRFMAAWSGLETTFSEYKSDFEAGKETTVTLTFDQEVKAQIGYNGANGYINAEGTKVSRTLTKTLTPANDYMNIQIMDMNGHKAVTLITVTVEQKEGEEPVESLHEFTEAWSGFEPKLSDYNAAFEAGKETTVTLTFDKEANAQMAFKTETSGWDAHTGKGKEVTATVVPKEDYINIQITDMAGESAIHLLSVKVEQKEGEEPIESLHEFTEAWSGFEPKLSDYNAAFEAGKETTVTLTFDKEANAQMAFKTETSGWDAHTGKGKEVTATVVPKEDYINIQITDMAGESAIHLLSVKVEQKEGEEPIESLHEFTEAWSGFEPKLSDYNAAFEAGKETTVTLTFDKEANAQMAFKTETSGWDAHTGKGKEVTATVVPKEDYINIQITDMAGESAIHLLSVKVEQKEGEEPIESLHEFTEAWSGFEPKLSDYNAAFEAGKETTVTLTFDKEANAQMAFKTETSGWDAHTGKGKEVTATVVPKEDYINIQITDMAGESAIHLLSVKVEQKEGEEPIESLHEFTEAWSGFEPKLSDYNAAFEAGKETTVTLTFDKEANAQMAFKTETSGWDTYPGKGKEVTATVVPKEDYINIQITDMAGESAIHLLSVKVEQAGSDANQSSFDDFILGDDPVHVFTEPETFIVDLADYDGEYEAGQGVSIEMNLFSDGNFYVLVEEADGTENVATNSNAKPVAERRMKMAVDKASPSNTGYLDFEGINGYESDEEGSLHIQWEGCPQSGVIAITILEMDGSQVNIDSLEMKEKSGAKSIKNATVQAAKRLATENFSDKNPDSKEKALVPAQEPAKKEEELTENMSDGNMENDETENPNIPKIPEGRREENGDLEDKFSVL